MRIFCFPYSGSGPSIFRDWHLSLPDEIDIKCCNLPGREYLFGEVLEVDLDKVVGRLYEEILMCADTPYILLGHSLGALLAHQLCVKLDEAGVAGARLLIVCGRSAPSDKNRYYERISHLSNEEFFERLPEYGGLPNELQSNKELIDIYLPILKADFTLSDSGYKDVRKVKCPILVFGGKGDRMDRDKLNLWKHETLANCEVEMFPGNHFFIVQDKQMVLMKLRQIVSSVAR